MKKREKGKTMKLLKISGYAILSVAITVFSILFLFRNGDIGAALLEKGIRNALLSAGVESEIQAIHGNPWRGYTAEGLELRASGILNARIGRIEVEPDIKGLFKWDPIEKVEIYESTLKIEDPSRLGSLKPQTSGKNRIPLPPIPLRIRDLSVSAAAHIVDIESADIYHAKNGTDISMNGSADGIPWRIDSVLETTEGLVLPALSMDFGNGRFLLSGDLMPFLRISGSAEDIDTALLGSLIPGTNGLRGIFSSVFKGIGTLAAPGISGDFTAEGTGFGKTSAGSLSGTWSFSDDTLAVRNIESGLFEKSFTASLSADITGKMDIQAQGYDLDLGKIAGTDPRLPAMTGKIDSFGLRLKGKIPDLNGGMDMTSEGFSLSGRRIDSLDAKVSINGGSMNIDSSLKWSGASAAVTGKADLRRKTVDLSVTAPDSDLQTMAAFAPSLRSADIKGTADLSFRIKGSFKKPEAEGSFCSPSLSIGDESFSNTDLTIAITGGDMQIRKFGSHGLGGSLEGYGKIRDLYGTPRMDIKLRGRHLDLSRISSLLGSVPEELEGTVDVDLSVGGTMREPYFTITSPLITIDGVVFQDLSADLAWKAPKLDIRSFSVSLLDGKFSASGSIITAPSPKLDLKGSFAELELKELPFASLPSVEGTADGDFTIGGSISAPDISFTAAVPALSSDYAFLHDIRLQGQAFLRGVDITTLDIGVGSGILKGSASLRLEADGPDLYFNISGSDLDTSALFPKYTSSTDTIAGNVDLMFGGHFGKKTLEGDGNITSANLSVAGLPLDSMDIPIEIGSDKINITGMKIRGFGGTLSGDLVLDMKDLGWESWFRARSVDIAPATDRLPDLAGKVAGTVLMDLNLKGRGSDRYAIFGHGLLEIKDGSIGGFPAIKAAAATAGRERIEFRRIKSNFMADGLGITLFGGTRAEAPPGYPLYRNIDLDGTLQYDGDLDLNGKAEVSMRALNAFTGALRLALDTALSRGNLVQNLFDGLKGIGKRDFRILSFEIGGSRSAPEVKKLEMEGGQEYLGRLLDIEDADKDKAYDDDRQIYIRLEFPVGPGSGSKEDTAGEQLRQQLIDGLIDSLFPKH